MYREKTPEQKIRELEEKISKFYGEIRDLRKHMGLDIQPYDGNLVDRFEKQQAEYTDAKAKGKVRQEQKLQADYTDAKEKQQAEYTDAKEVLEKLKGIAKDEFSAMVTHELRTPLVPIIGYCKMLKTSMLGRLDQEQYEAIEIIEKNAKRLEHLITDIMNVRKLDLNKLKFKIEDLSLDEFFAEIYSSYEPTINQKGHKFVINISDKHMIIKTDKIRLRQIFDNLISNALKFMPEKNGLIEIGLKKENENLVFHVKDNGLGIPLDKQNEIFQKFYQVDTSERRKITGTGLGLAISKGITEGLGGRIWFESDGESGTTFYMKFPL
jgi:signal transduction histidine kinase